MVVEIVVGLAFSCELGSQSYLTPQTDLPPTV